MFDDDGVKIGSRYTIWYEGSIFFGDEDGLNSHDLDRWDDVSGLINAYPEIHVRDNEYGVTYSNGEWY